MANVMLMQNIKNNVHRSGFDLSFRNLFTSKTGEIVPVGIVETIPGDHFKINMSNFMRTVPFETASFARLRHYVDVYFVPNRLLWDKFPAWIVQTKNQYFAKSAYQPADNFNSQPYLTAQNIANYLEKMARSNNTVDDGGLNRVLTTIKLLSYLGYGDYSYDPEDKSVFPPYPSNVPLNIFPLLAYQKVYQDFFRFSQWENAAPWTYNLDYVLTNDRLNIDINNVAQYTNMFDMRYCNYDKDLFNGILPSSQFGDESIASPIVGNLSGWLSTSLVPPQDPGSINLVAARTGSSDGTVALGDDSPVGALDISNYVDLALERNQSNNAGLSMLSLRFAEALQKWKEITLSGSSDYKEQLYKHWNVRVSDYASDRCEYVGGMSETINISEVVNQNLAETGSDANLAGKGTLAQNGSIDFSTNEYGVLIMLSHVKPVIEWKNDSVLHPFMLRHSATDYAIPEFDNLGMQSMPVSMMRIDPLNTDSPQVLGFGPRYYDYKTNYDRVNGGFLTMPQWTLIHQPVNFENTKQGVKLSPKFFRVYPNITDNLFLPLATGSSESDLYYHSLYFDIKCTRNLSYDGMPY